MSPGGSTMVARKVGVGRQLLNLWRCLRDSYRHRKFVAKKSPLDIPDVFVKYESREQFPHAIYPAIDTIVVQQHPAFCGFAAAQTIALAINCQTSARNSSAASTPRTSTTSREQTSSPAEALSPRTRSVASSAKTSVDVRPSSGRGELSAVESGSGVSHFEFNPDREAKDLSYVYMEENRSGLDFLRPPLFVSAASPCNSTSVSERNKGEKWPRWSGSLSDDYNGNVIKYVKVASSTDKRGFPPDQNVGDTGAQPPEFAHADRSCLRTNTSEKKAGPDDFGQHDDPSSATPVGGICGKTSCSSYANLSCSGFDIGRVPASTSPRSSVGNDLQTGAIRPSADGDGVKGEHHQALDATSSSTTTSGNYKKIQYVRPACARTGFQLSPQFRFYDVFQVNFPPDFFVHCGFAILDYFPNQVKFRLLQQLLMYDGVPLVSLRTYFETQIRLATDPQFHSLDDCSWFGKNKEDQHDLAEPLQNKTSEDHASPTFLSQPAARRPDGVDRSSTKCGASHEYLLPPVKRTEYISGDSLSLDEFRRNVLEKLGVRRPGRGTGSRTTTSSGIKAEDEDPFLAIVSYSRTAVGQKHFSGGHVAPIGGYDPENDRVLILEVNVWRYPSVWIPTELLWRGIRTTTAVGISRGLLKVYYEVDPALGGG
ncbi:unnamed protein product [Amoebophrya sp. A120]|nr:unnamed protein product [Amoebophrya sp. A120]|eukprot:GSA120T00021578001.1